MNLIKNFIQRDFTITPNGLIFDRSLPKDSRFLFIYMAAKPDTFEFFLEALAEELDWHPDTLRKYLTPLLRRGWISRTPRRSPGGKFDTYEYRLHAFPTLVAPPVEPHPVFSDTVKDGARKNRVHNNKNNPLTGPKPEIQTPVTADEWLNGADERLETGQRLLRETFEKYPAMAELLLTEARVKATTEELLAEADAWLRYNRENTPVITNPGKFLRGGKASLYSWLQNPIREIHKQMRERVAGNNGKPQAASRPWAKAEPETGSLTYDRPKGRSGARNGREEQGEVNEVTNRLKA